MVESEVIIKRLSYLDEYLRDLTEVEKNTSWQQFQADKVTRRYVERTLHMAIEACIDISNHIISYEGYREPTNNKDVFQVLYEHNIIDELLNEHLQKMAQFRNIIVHDYIRLQPEIVYSILQKHLSDIVKYTHTIQERFLR